ncbi:MAG: DUF1836 domain-containing protein [Clostridiales bacterium]|nr:DUF1836 domain-containing protein [Clostridiales bacterium]
MFMKEDLLTQLFELINNSEDIQIDEIPEYHLYISQLEEFFDKKLKKSNGDEDERKTISKTMIQNYIKDGLLMPPEGKSYNSSHVILLSLIYNLKYILSIRDIRRLLNPILADIEHEDSAMGIESLYESYLELKQDSIQILISSLENLTLKVDKQIADANKPEEEEQQLKLLLFISALVSEANQRKKIAEFIIEKYFNLDN